MNAWYVVRRIAHGVTWLVLLLVPHYLLAYLIASSFAQGYGFASGVFLVAWVLLLPVLGWVWIYAIRQRWSLKWPLIVAVVLLWPFGLLWITAIGLGKLIIYAHGRGGDYASSDLREPAVIDARPGSLLENPSYE